MTTRIFSRTFLPILMLLVLFGTQSAWAALGTIVLKSGDRFERVDYMVVKAYKVVQFETSGQKKSVSFTDIQSILDRDGVDVTTQVLGGDYRKADTPSTSPTTPSSPTSPTEAKPATNGEQTWLEPDHEVYQRHRFRPWDIALQLGPNFTLPVGHYYDGTTSGVGFGADLVIPFSHNMSLRATVSMAGTKLEDSYVIQRLPPWFTYISDDVDVNIWRYMISAQYQKAYKEYQFDKGYWFLYSGIGITKTSFNGHAITTDDTNGDVYTLTFEPDKSRFTMTLGAGGVSMLSRSIGIQYAASYDMIFLGTASNSSGYETMQYAYNFDIRAGLVFHVGAKNDRE